VESRTNLTTETKIVKMVHFSRKGPCFWIPRFFRYIWGMPKGRLRRCSRPERAWMARPVEGAHHLCSFGPRGPSRVIPKLQSPCFGEKPPWFFSRFYFPWKQIERRLLLKTMSDSAVLSKYGEILEQIIEQSTWESWYIWDVSVTYISNNMGLVVI
jgi:hypothetical protein